MKKLSMAMLIGWALIPVAGWAQNSDSLNIAADQAVSMNKLDDLMGRAEKRLSYIMTNLGDLSDNNDANNSFDKFKDNLEDMQSIREDIKDQIDKAKADFDVLDKQLREVGGDANDLTALLLDLQKYFASSFTPDSIKTCTPMIEKARTASQEMVKSVDVLRDNIYKQKKEVKGTSGN